MKMTEEEEIKMVNNCLEIIELGKKINKLIPKLKKLEEKEE